MQSKRCFDLEENELRAKKPNFQGKIILRMVLGFRKLNKKTFQNSYPLPK